MAFGLVAGLAGRFAGKAARWAARRAMGTPVRRAVTSVVGGAATGAAATGLVNLGRRALNPMGNPFGEGPGSLPADANMNSKRGKWVQKKDGRWVWQSGYRRMNYLNQRALKKSIRRVQGFEKIVRSAFSVSKGSLQLKKRRAS